VRNERGVTGADSRDGQRRDVGADAAQGQRCGCERTRDARYGGVAETIEQRDESDVRQMVTVGAEIRQR
jgi:hypothetical protein